MSQTLCSLDETALFYNAEPNRTLVIKGETCHGQKKYKGKLTVLLFFNMEESVKSWPLVLGKSELPCCLKNIKNCTCEYEASQNAWVSMKMFHH